MNTIEAILTRRSIRAYEDKLVDMSIVEKILECGKFAPSARNMQPWHFSVVVNPQVLREYSSWVVSANIDSQDQMMQRMVADKNFDLFRGAPMAIVMSGDTANRYSKIDCALAMENMALCCTEFGLGSVIIGLLERIPSSSSYKNIERERMNIPNGYEPYIALAFGYPAEELGERAVRKENTVSYIK